MKLASHVSIVNEKGFENVVKQKLDSEGLVERPGQGYGRVRERACVLGCPCPSLLQATDGVGVLKHPRETLCACCPVRFSRNRWAFASCP